MRYHLVTLGCPKNTTDSNRIAGTLEAAGHRHAADRADADLVILNTCGFIDEAKAESAEAAEILAAEQRGRINSSSSSAAGRRSSASRSSRSTASTRPSGSKPGIRSRRLRVQSSGTYQNQVRRSPALAPRPI